MIASRTRRSGSIYSFATDNSIPRLRELGSSNDNTCCRHQSALPSSATACRRRGTPCADGRRENAGNASGNMFPPDPRHPSVAGRNPTASLRSEIDRARAVSYRVPNRITLSLLTDAGNSAPPADNQRNLELGVTIFCASRASLGCETCGAAVVSLCSCAA